MKRVFNISVIVFALCMLAVGWVLMSSHFLLRRIEIFGLSTVHEEEIMKRLPFDRGANLFLLSTGDAENAIKIDRRINAVTVSKSFPNGIIIEVVEKSSVYLLNCGEIWGLTDDGEAIPVLDVRKLPSLPIIDAGSQCCPKPYYKVADSSVLRAIAYLNKIAIERPEFLDIISGIYSPAEREFELVLINDGVKIKIKDQPEALDRLAVILDNLDKGFGEALEIDLRFPNQGIVRCLSGETQDRS